MAFLGTHLPLSSQAELLPQDERYTDLAPRWRGLISTFGITQFLYSSDAWFRSSSMRLT